jgi:hypothetical protein
MTRARVWAAYWFFAWIVAALASFGCKAQLTDSQIDAMTPADRAAELQREETQTTAIETAATTAQTIGAILPQPWGLILSALGVGVASIAADRRICRRKSSTNSNPEIKA